LRLVLGPWTDQTRQFGLPAGSYHGRSLSGANGNAFVYHWILDKMIDNAFEAEQQGYDGYVIRFV